ncbi:hypothetical protein G9C98_002683 [Cotesia typhae]|uniref:Uncharacterized protein n=1 Tax=Cotesia typhae TaxID=2053667 RepID=A0A8J5R575_9HYME|nr:hypothetical protein G9C98_002683 [Cotesia typhae]
MSASMISNAKLQDDMSSIPLADDDPQVIIPEEDVPDNETHMSDPFGRGHSMDSIPSTFTNGSCSPNNLSQRVDSVKEENLKLRSENQVLGQYIENLMSASSVFQSTSPKTKKK